MSEATKALAAGVLLSFADGGVHELRGLDGPRRLYAYASEEPQGE